MWLGKNFEQKFKTKESHLFCFSFWSLLSLECLALVHNSPQSSRGGSRTRTAAGITDLPQGHVACAVKTRANHLLLQVRAK